MFMQAIGAEPRIDQSGDGWPSFKASIKLRNRITHPKRLADFNVSDEEVRTLHRAVEWWSCTIYRTMLSPMEAAAKKFGLE
jgi:hypothetical protein